MIGIKPYWDIDLYKVLYTVQIISLGKISLSLNTLKIIDLNNAMINSQVAAYPNFFFVQENFQFEIIDK